jgi:hypothetical protein
MPNITNKCSIKDYTGLKCNSQVLKELIQKCPWSWTYSASSRPTSWAYLEYCVTPSNYGLLPQDTSLRERVEKSCWTSLAWRQCRSYDNVLLRQLALIWGAMSSAVSGEKLAAHGNCRVFDEAFWGANYLQYLVANIQYLPIKSNKLALSLHENPLPLSLQHKQYLREQTRHPRVPTFRWLGSNSLWRQQMIRIPNDSRLEHLHTSIGDDINGREWRVRWTMCHYWSMVYNTGHHWNL